MGTVKVYLGSVRLKARNIELRTDTGSPQITAYKVGANEQAAGCRKVTHALPRKRSTTLQSLMQEGFAKPLGAELMVGKFAELAQCGPHRAVLA
jgi:hypothetical protein